jgi:hypothetical protein
MGIVHERLGFLSRFLRIRNTLGKRKINKSRGASWGIFVQFNITIQSMPAIFLNVDLAIESPESLDHLCSGLVERGAFNLYNGEFDGGFLATFEVPDERSGRDPDSIITTLCNMLDGLDDRAKVTWDRAQRRTFDIGYETDDAAGSVYTDLKSDVLARVVAHHADIRLTVYSRR